MRGATGRIHGFARVYLRREVATKDQVTRVKGIAMSQKSTREPASFTGVVGFTFEAKKTEASRNLLGANRKEDASGEHRPFDLFSPGFATSLKACSTSGGNLASSEFQGVRGISK